MKLFAIELSSKYGSIALVEDGQIVAEKSWLENFKNRQQLFDSIEELQREQALDWDSVDCFAAGRGPGAFSGMRIAFSVVNSLAQPGGKPVYALSSGHVLAAQVDADCVAVVGDARRQQVWAGAFQQGQITKDYKLMALDELAAFIPLEARVVSPDHDRLEELLADFNTTAEKMPLYPTAGTLGKLVAQRLDEGIPSEPFEPLYMHPPVFIAPRFPA